MTTRCTACGEEHAANAVTNYRCPGCGKLHVSSSPLPLPLQKACLRCGRTIRVPEPPPHVCPAATAAHAAGPDEPGPDETTAAPEATTAAAQGPQRQAAQTRSNPKLAASATKQQAVQRAAD